MRLLPINAEKHRMTHGKYGAVKVINPNNVICTYGFRRPQMYNIIKVNELLRKCTFVKMAMILMDSAPKPIIQIKSAVLPRNEFSSNNLQ